jgi:hypothetical protein
MIKSRKMRWAGHVAQMGEKRNRYRLVVGMPKGKRPLGRPSLRNNMELFSGDRRANNTTLTLAEFVRDVERYNIKMDHGEIGWEGMEGTGLAVDSQKGRALSNAIMNLWVSDLTSGAQLYIIT